MKKDNGKDSKVADTQSPNSPVHLPESSGADRTDTLALQLPEKSNQPRNYVWTKKRIIIGACYVVLLLAGALAWYLLRAEPAKNRAPQTNVSPTAQSAAEPDKQASTSQSAPKKLVRLPSKLPPRQTSGFDRPIILTDELDISLMDPKTYTLSVIFTPSEQERDTFCGMGGCSWREVSVSRDYSKIAFNKLLKNGKESIGYYDRSTKKVTVLTEGSDPSWSPDGTRIAYSGPGGASIITIGTGAITTIDDSAAKTNEHGQTIKPDIIGWTSNIEIVFNDRRTWDSDYFSIGNAQTKSKQKIIVKAPSDKDDVNISSVLSPDGTMLLANINHDPAIVNVDGTGLTRVFRVPEKPFPGSGYGNEAFSPDSNTILLTNNYLGSSSTETRKRTNSELEVFDFDGKKRATTTGHRFKSPTDPCWYDDSRIFVPFYLDDFTSYLGVFDTSKNTVTKITEAFKYKDTPALHC